MSSKFDCISFRISSWARITSERKEDTAVGISGTTKKNASTNFNVDNHNVLGEYVLKSDMSKKAKTYINTLSMI